MLSFLSEIPAGAIAMTAQIIIGVSGLATMACGIMFGRNSWISSGLVGTGLGAGVYAILLTLTDDPLCFMLDVLARLAG